MIYLIFKYYYYLDIIFIHCNEELKTLFQQFETSVTKDFTLTLPNKNHPFFFTVDFSSTGIGCVLLQMNDKGKLDLI